MPPEPFSPTPFDVNDVAVANGFVYVTTDHALHRLPRDGSSVTTLDRCLPWTLGLTCDAEHAYWVSRACSPWAKSLREHNECDIMATPCAGGPSVVLAPDQRGVLALATDDDTVYWINEESPYDSPDGRVMACPKRGGAPREVASGLLFMRGVGKLLGIDATSLYAVVYLPDDPETDRDEMDGDVIVRIPKAGGQAQIFATGLRVDTGLVADDTHLYAVDDSGGRVVRFETSGTGACDALQWAPGRHEARWEPEFHAGPDLHRYMSDPPGGDGAPRLLVADTEHLYVFSRRVLDEGRRYGHRLVRIPKHGGATRELVAWDGSYGPFHAATDGHHVYFEVDRTLCRVPTGA